MKEQEKNTQRSCIKSKVAQNHPDYEGLAKLTNNVTLEIRKTNRIYSGINSDFAKTKQEIEVSLDGVSKENYLIKSTTHRKKGVTMVNLALKTKATFVHNEHEVENVLYNLCQELIQKLYNSNLKPNGFILFRVIYSWINIYSNT